MWCQSSSSISWFICFHWLGNRSAIIRWPIVRIWPLLAREFWRISSWYRNHIFCWISYWNSFFCPVAGLIQPLSLSLQAPWPIESTSAREDSLHILPDQIVLDELPKDSLDDPDVVNWTADTISTKLVCVNYHSKCNYYRLIGWEGTLEKIPDLFYHVSWSLACIGNSLPIRARHWWIRRVWERLWEGFSRSWKPDGLGNGRSCFF